MPLTVGRMPRYTEQEAREVELSESGIRKGQQGNSLLSRLLGKKK